MAIQKLLEKNLEDGNKLRLKTWVSDVISPGKRMFQLDFLIQDGEHVCGTIQFPTRYECFSENQIRDMYDAVRTKEDFDGLRKQYASFA